jgi:hypothetical protein
MSFAKKSSLVQCECQSNKRIQAKKCKKASFGHQRKFVANLHFEKQIKQKKGEGKV